MAENKFKSTEQLFAKISEDFSSFNAANLIEEGRFYTGVAYILKLLGIAWYIESEDIIDVKNYRAELPADFRVLDSAYKCQGGVVNDTQPAGVLLKKLSFDHYPETQIPDTHVKPDCTDYWSLPKCEIFNRHEIVLVERNDGLIYQFRNPTLLKLGNVSTRNCCSEDCPNVHSQSPDTISIQNNKIYTNFKEGHIYLTYHAFPLDPETGLPLIPDNEIIENCIEYYLKHKLIENLWVNNDVDVSQKVRYFEDKYKEALGQAVYETKLPSFSTMINNIRLVRKRLNTYQISPYR